MQYCNAWLYFCSPQIGNAQVAELVDAQDLKSCFYFEVRVRFPSWAHLKANLFLRLAFFVWYGFLLGIAASSSALAMPRDARIKKRPAEALFLRHAALARLVQTTAYSPYKQPKYAYINDVVCYILL